MEILTKINWVDVLIAIVILRTSFLAFQDGMSHQIFPLLGASAMIVCGLHYYAKIGLFLQNNLVRAPLALLNCLSFISIIVITGFVFKFIKAVIDKLIKVSWHPLVEKFGGIVIGILRSALVVSIILIILSLLPLSYFQKSIREKSLTGMYFLRIGPAMYSKISRFMPSLNIGTTPAADESIMKDLTADKSIGPNAKNTK